MLDGGGCVIAFIRVSLFLVSSPDNPEYSTTRSIIIRCGLLLLAHFHEIRSFRSSRLHSLDSNNNYNSICYIKFLTLIDMDVYTILSPQEVAADLAKRVRQRRLA